MAELFPRTTVGGVSVPRLIIGTNWFQGASHTTVAKDNLIRGYQTRRHYVALRLADILTAFLDRGVDAILWVPTPELDLAVRDAEQRTGKPMIQFINPWFNLAPGGPADEEPDVVLDRCRERGMIPGLSTHAPETVVYADR